MLFPTIDFAIFFGIVFVLNWLLAPSPRYWKLFILAASYVFYGWWDWRFVFLLAASTVATTLGGIMVHRSQTDRGRNFCLGTTVAVELGLLAWFKYYGFFAQSVDNALHSMGLHGSFPLLNVTLPVGISFFTFMGLSYVIDIHRRRLEPAKPIDVAVFVAFFPHLVAGPIVRGSELIPQIERSHRRNPRNIDFPRAAYLIMAGLFKKVVLSSYVSSAIVDPVFATPSQHSGLETLFAVWGYAVQIYCDFSGYTDIAIGCAMLLGFRFPENFNSPYTARSLQDFWRRWHMTLSFWLRDYLYIPLGGNQGGDATMYRNIMITMVLGGLWHGASWTFVCWGALHGLAIMVNHLWVARRLRRGHAPSRALAIRASCWLATYIFICVTWALFRSQSFAMAATVLHKMSGLAPGGIVWFYSPLVMVLPLVIGGHAVGIIAARRVGSRPITGTYVLLPLPGFAGAFLAACWLLVLLLFGGTGANPFIYFQF